ncbi:MAG: hypothetical protein ACKO3B_01340, partial [Bacteroidota bacterium]
MAAPAVSGQNTSDTQSKVAVGDVNYDGIPDAVITSKWNSEIRVVATKIQQQGAKTLSPGDIKADFKTTGQGAAFFKDIPNLSNACKPANLLFEHEVLIGEVIKTSPRAAEIFAIVSNRKGNPESPPDCYYLIGFTYKDDGLQVISGYPIAIGTDRPGIPGLTDFDGDGKVELYLKNRIYAAENGKLLAEGTGNWDTEVNSAPSAVNLNKTGNQEFVVGNVIYNVPSLANRNPASPQALNSFYAKMNDTPGLPAGKIYFTKVYNDPVEYGIDNHSSTALGDGDNDGNIDIFISGAVNSNTGKTSVFYWNVQKQSVDVFSPVDPDPANNLGWPWGTSRINVADADGDGKINLNFIAGNQLFSMRIDGSTTSPSGPAGTIVNNWAGPRTINDTRSGVVTCTVYDFDNDNNPELVYRDSQELVVIDGKTGTNKKWSATCQSHTFTEGPIIADVNDDGATDICVPCYRNANPFSVTGGLQQQAL